MSSTRPPKKPARVGTAQHRVVLRQPPAGKPQPTLGSHPQGGTKSSTTLADSGTGSQQQQQ